MLSVIVEARGPAEPLAGVLAALASAAVEGLVREVLVVAAREVELADALCEASGARLDPDVATAVQRAKADWLLVLPAEIRLRDGWVGRLKDVLVAGPTASRITGARNAGLFARSPVGVLIEKRRAAGLAHPDLQQLRGAVGRRGRRLA